VILAGTNDIAGNTGPMTNEEIQGNLQSMAELAKANGIKVIFASITPTSAYHVSPNGAPQTVLRPMARIIAVNDWMKKYAAANGHIYVDYFSPMLDASGVMKSELFARLIQGLRGTSVRVNFDTANPLVWGEDTLPLFEQVKDRLAILHVADTAQKGEFKFCRIGQGIAPIEEVFRRARAQGFDGWVSIEEASRTGPDGFREAVTFVRSAWARAA